MLPFSFFADVEFWVELNKYKLDVQKLSEDPVHIQAYYTLAKTNTKNIRLSFRGESFPNAPTHSYGGSIQSQITGVLTNFNTKEAFNNLTTAKYEEAALLHAKAIISSQNWKKDLTLLNYFYAYSFADIKSYRYSASLMLPYPNAKAFQVNECTPINENQKLQTLAVKLRQYITETKKTYFYVHYKDSELMLTSSICDINCNEGICFGYLDASYGNFTNPILLNYLNAFKQSNIKVNQIICIRDIIVVNPEVPIILKDSKVIKATYEFDGTYSYWLTNAKKEREVMCVDLKSILDPKL